MTKEKYIRLMNYWRQHPAYSKKLIFAAKIFPLILFTSYPLTALYLILTGDKKIILFIAIPALDFIFVSILRKILDFQRPYSVYNTDPLIKSNNKPGCSFPSRHSASAVVIAAACMYINPLYGIFMSLASSFVLVTRVLSGAHFIRDVVCGALISLAFALIFFIG